MTGNYQLIFLQGDSVDGEEVVPERWEAEGLAGLAVVAVNQPMMEGGGKAHASHFGTEVAFTVLSPIHRLRHIMIIRGVWLYCM